MCISRHGKSIRGEVSHQLLEYSCCLPAFLPTRRLHWTNRSHPQVLCVPVLWCTWCALAPVCGRGHTPPCEAWRSTGLSLTVRWSRTPSHLVGWTTDSQSSTVHELSPGKVIGTDTYNVNSYHWLIIRMWCALGKVSPVSEHLISVWSWL